MPSVFVARGTVVCKKTDVRMHLAESRNRAFAPSLPWPGGPGSCVEGASELALVARTHPPSWEPSNNLD